MKFTCNQSDLSASLALVGRAISPRSSHPILSNVKLIANEADQNLCLVGFDLSLGMQVTCPAVVDVSGALMLPAQLLGAIVSKLPSGEVALAVDPEDCSATLSSVAGSYQLRGVSAEEFPDLPDVAEGSGAAKLAPEFLADGLQGTLFAASGDETKQILTGVHLTLEQEQLEFAATDGHRLAIVQGEEDGDKSALTSSPTDEATASIQVTVPAKALQELQRMLQMHPSTQPIALRFDQSQAVFEVGDQRLTSRLLEGQYPNYQRLLPKDFSHQITMERQQLIGALDRIAVLAEQKNNIVKLSFSHADQVLQISVEAQDVGSGQEIVPVQMSGGDLEIEFIVKYLDEGLKALRSGEVQMQCNSPTSPMVVVPLGNLKMTYLVMPVQIRS